MQKRKLGLLFLGRLEQEKGFDLIFDFINQYPNEELPFEIYIFGTGSYENGILELSNRFKQVHYFGWKPLSEVERYLENIDYCLMPSRFLETFGLSAINVLKWGIPVVGFRKGGLIPFIMKGYDIEECEGSTEFAKFSTMLIKLQEEKEKESVLFYKELAEKSKSIANRYTKEKWFESFQNLTFDFKVRKIVMVSDFINKIGGIETYIHDVKSLLESKGYEVVLFGSTCPKGILGKIKKIFGIGLGMCNIYRAIKFLIFIKNEKPDLIWYHSMLRWLGWMPLGFTKKIHTKRWMMYHDFGYFDPYPHSLYETTYIKKLSLKNYIKQSHTRNPIKWILISGKYLSLKLLKNQLKSQIDLHLVPSEFMVPIVEKSFGIRKEKIKSFNHFLQE